MARRTGFVWHELYAWHSTPPFGGFVPFGNPVQPGEHVENPETKRRLRNLLEVSGLLKSLVPLTPRPATEAELLRFHTPEHVAHIREQSKLIHAEGGLSSPLGHGSYEIARLAAGGVIEAVEAVLKGTVDNAYALVRPPGHHAESGRAMGFCLFNNVAVGAYHAINAHGVKRVAIVDFDVHHGNGTEDIVSGDERVLFCSTFQHPFYPHTGYAGSATNIVNTPLSAGDGGAAFRRAVEHYWLPRLEAFAPELILISAGFDAHTADTMAGLNLVESDYAWVTRRLVAQAERSAGGRIVSSLEGGYDLHALARSVEAHLKAFLD